MHFTMTSSFKIILFSNFILPFCIICFSSAQSIIEDSSKLSAKLLMQPSVEQTKENLSKLFEKIDEDKNNYILIEELIKWIEITNEQKALLDAKIHMDRFDLNKDQLISWEEYLEGYYGNITLEFANQSLDHKEIVQLIGEEKFQFKVADKDKDGKLNSRELKIFYHPHHYPEMIEFEVYKTLQGYDVNHDDKISRDEYIVTHYQTRKISPEKLEKVAQFFDKYDIDKDAALDADEIAKWLLPDVIGFSKIEAKELMQNSDDNKDDRLDKKEVLDNFGHWIHSKATNYGRQLYDEL